MELPADWHKPQFAYLLLVMLSLQGRTLQTAVVVGTEVGSFSLKQVKLQAQETVAGQKILCSE